MRRLRGDYEAVVLLVLSLIATGVAMAQIGLVNGPAGLALIPKPLTSTLGLSSLGYQWVYLAWSLFLVLVIFLFLRRLLRAPFGRNLRAVRDNEAAAAAVGRNVFTLRMQSFVIGGMIAGLSGALLVEFVNAWAPGSWLYPETFALITAIIVGGRANMGGVTIGTILVPVLFLEVTRFLPSIGYPGLIDALEWVVIGLLTLIFMWFRPQGLLPERRRRFAPGFHLSPPPEQVLRRFLPVGSDLALPHPLPSVPAQAAGIEIGVTDLLSITDLQCTFGGLRAVAGATICCKAGEITGLIGPNGAGKSTVLNAVAGTVRSVGGIDPV